LKNSAYVGHYTNDYFGDISIIDKASQVVVENLNVRGEGTFNRAEK